MADTEKLSVEKALNKIRAEDRPKTQSEKRDEQMGELDEEIKRMRAQRARLDRTNASAIEHVGQECNRRDHSFPMLSFEGRS